MDRRALIDKSSRIVIKLGTAVLMREEGGIALSRFYSFVEDIAKLRQAGKEVLVVTSGAVGLGVQKLGLKQKPKELPLKQACAAVGQGHLMALYSEAFAALNLAAAQILLTEDDLADRKRYLNLRSTISELLRLGVIPIINENDTVSTVELESTVTATPRKINFGDNDKLSALVAGKVDADLLLILTDVEGVFTADPRQEPTAKLIETIEHLTPQMMAQILGSEEAMAIEASAENATVAPPDGEESGAAAAASAESQMSKQRKTALRNNPVKSGTTLGRGGMTTKLEAARIATESGCATIIAGGKLERAISRLFNGEQLGTLFLPKAGLPGKLRWIAFATSISAAILINKGAKDALLSSKASLLPAGVTGVEGNFNRGDVVSIFDEGGNEFARGIVNYSASEIRRICGVKSDEIEGLIGHKNYDAVVTRDNIAFLKR